MRILFLTLVFSLLMPNLGHAWPVQILIDTLEPPPMAVGKRSSVAVGTLKGWEAEAIRDSIVTALKNPKFKNEVIESTKGQKGGLVIRGTIAEPIVVDDMEDIVVKKDRVVVTTTETDHVLTRTVTIRFDMEVIDASSGKRRGKERIEKSVSAKTGKQSNPEKALAAAKDPVPMAESLIDDIGVVVAQAISPRIIKDDFVLEKTKTTKIGVLKASSQRDFAWATDWFVGQSKLSPYDEWIHFNAAVMLALTGHLKDSAKALEKATAIKARPRFVVFGEKLEKLGPARAELAKIGHPHEVVKWKGAAGDAATTITVKVKGGAGKSWPLTKEPGAGEVITQVPGGMSLSVVEMGVTHLKVKTFDGKVGWIEAKRVK